MRKKPMGTTKLPWIQTYSETVFNIFQPDKNDIHIEDIAHSLAQIPRFTGHMPQPYSVAQHSVLVSQLVNKQYAREGLLHDAAEAYLNDLNKVAKRNFPDYQAAEKNLLGDILRKFGCKPELPKAVYEADEKALRLEIMSAFRYGSPLWKEYVKNPFELVRLDFKLPEPWGFQMAKAQFLARYNELFELPYLQSDEPAVLLPGDVS
jgi:hypothetical protein